MKKFIALVLSLVMALSLCAPAWGEISASNDPAGLKVLSNGSAEYDATTKTYSVKIDTVAQGGWNESQRNYYAGYTVDVTDYNENATVKFVDENGDEKNWKLSDEEEDGFINNGRHQQWTPVGVDRSPYYYDVDGDGATDFAIDVDVSDAMVEVATAEELKTTLNRMSAGAAIIFTQNVTLSETVNITADTVIDGNGKTLTYTGSNRAIDVTKETNGADLTISDLTISFPAGYRERGINYNTSGTLTLNNVTIGSETAYPSYAVNFPGAADGATAVISNCNLYGCIAVNVWGENMTVTVTSSDLTTVDNSDAEGYAVVKLNNDGETSAEGSVINVSGGSVNITGTGVEDSIEFINSTSTGTINIDNPPGGSVVGTVAVIRYPGTDNSYGFSSLEAAAKKATAADIITLINDVTLSEDIILPCAIEVNKGADVTLDLNGKTISHSKAQTGTYAMIVNEGTLTIKDSVGTGVISYTDSGTGGEYASNTIRNNGVLNVTGGTIENMSSDSVAAAGYPHAIDVYPGSTTNITGGAVKSLNYDAIRMFCSSTTVATTVNISGGTIHNRVTFQVPGAYAAYGVLNITGGTFTNDLSGDQPKNTNVRLLLFGTDLTNMNANISGGNFDEGLYVQNNTGSATAPAWTPITGGYFNTDPSDYVADGYGIVESDNDDYAYQVAKVVATVGTTNYASLKDAVDAVANGGTINIKVAGQSAVVSEAKTFTVTGEKATITAGTGYDLTVDGNKYTVKNLYTVSFDANGGADAMVNESVVDGDAYTLPACGFAAPEGKQFKGWSVDGKEYAVGDEIDVTADVTVVAMWAYLLPVTNDPEVDVIPPVVSTGDEVDMKNATVNDVVKTITTGVEIDHSAITEAAEDAADDSKVVPTKEQAKELNKLPNISGTTVNDVAIVVQTYYDVEIEKVEVDESTNKTSSITVDITPMQQTVATTETVVENEDDIKVGKNAVQVGKPVPVKITEPVEITLKMPSTCFEVGQKVYITHKASVGTVIYEAVVAVDYTITFTTTHGFSPFTISSTPVDVKASVGTDNYADLQSAVNYMGKDATVIVKAKDQSAVVDFATTFTVKYEGEATKDNTKITAVNGYYLTAKDVADGVQYTVSRIYYGGYAGGTTSTTTKPVQSAATFDAGIGLYIGMSVLSAMGGAVVIGKKKD